MSEYFNLPDLASGERGLHCDPDEMIEVPANLVIELTKIFEHRDVDAIMEDHYGMHPGQINWLCNVVAQYADELEQRHEKAIRNRNRARSKNRLI